MTPRVLWHKTSPILLSFGTFFGILIVALGVIAYGRGYRVDVNNTSLKPTGLISATSDPIGAQVYVEGKLKAATNTSFNIDPGFYTVRIAKEGYIGWQKTLRVQGEVVSRADAFLFPTSPSLSPITTLGIEHPTLSPDGSKIAYIIPETYLDEASQKKAGLWVYALSDGPLGRNRDPIQIDKTFNGGPDLTRAIMVWSPDTTQLLVYNMPGTARLYDVSGPDTFEDVSLTREQLLVDWDEQRTLTQQQKLAAFKQPIISFATASASIIAFSPDETKFLYEASQSAIIPNVIEPALIGTNSSVEQRTIIPGNIYVYDGKEDKNFLVLDKKEIPTPLPTPKPARGATPTPTPTNSLSAKPQPLSPILWFPTSRHLIVPMPGKIDVMEYDRTNWVTIYSGPLIDGFVAPWSNGSRVIILTNLNPDASTLPNLYTVNLR